MKKTALLLALAVSVASMAATTGSIKAYNENATNYKKGSLFIDEIEKTKSTFGIKTEAKVNGSGFSFGSDVKAKDLTVFDANKTPATSTGTHPTILENVKDNSSVWAKYELPELNGVMSYVKGTYETKGNAILEASVSYKALENINAGVEFSNTFHSIFLNAKASYKKIKDVELTGEIHFNHSLDGKKVKYYDITAELDNDAIITDEPEYRHTVLTSNLYVLTGTYKGLKDTEITAKSYVTYLVNDLEKNNAGELLYKDSELIYGLALDSKFAGIDNLVLSSKNFFFLYHDFKIEKTQPSTVEQFFLALKLNANIEYTHKATDKLTIKPSLGGSFFCELPIINPYSVPDYFHLYITPKIVVEYKPVESLTISGSITPIVSFKNYHDYAVENFGYKNTTVRTGLNIEYTW